MSENVNSTQSLQRDVDELRERFSATQELYREVAALLFFRYGITPTANRLYQLVRKGSMSAPAQALQSFWEELREKSRVRIDHADLPESLASKVGELTSQLWLDALSHAKNSYQVFYDETTAKLDEASSSQAALQLQLQEKEQLLARTLLLLDKSKANEQLRHQELAALRQDLHHEQSAKATLTAETKALKLALENQQAQFTADLDKLQNAIVLTEERARASERMALMEIEKERSLRLSVEKSLNSAVITHQNESEQQQTQQQALREDIAVLKHQLRSSQAMYSEAENKQNKLQSELTQANTELTKQLTQIAVTQQEKLFLSQQCTELQQQLLLAQENHRIVLPRRHRRK